MHKKHFLWSSLGLVFVLFSLFAFNPKSGDRLFEISKNLDIFATLYKEVNTYYVDEVNPNELIETGINAMLSSLDPYTNYIPEDDIEDFRTMTTGQYAGIGALVGNRNGKNTIIMPYKDLPAEKAGLKIGDEILKIDGVDASKRNSSEISKLLKGQANTDIELTIRRYGQDEPLNIPLTRDKIKINNVPYFGMVGEATGYIKLSDFTNGAGKEVKAALLQLKEDGAEKIILDLRDNPGGLLSEAVNVSNVFIEKNSEVVSTKGKMTDWNKSYKALNAPVDTEIPLVVLTSSRSASAAEIVAGVVQDYDRGVLVGQKTFGKGLVQATRPLTYNSQLKVTTAKYYTPSGRCIQAIDYSHRAADGSVGKMADSLKTAFETSNGRPVFDGGGVDPDFAVVHPKAPSILVSLMSKGHIFDFATQYHHNNADIGGVESFEIDDALYANFVDWVSDKDYDYKTRVEKKIEELIEQAKKEQYYEDINDQIYALNDRVKHNKEADLENFRKEISYMLKEEIVSRYYLQEGIIRSSFAHDPDIAQALKVLKDSQTYQETLALK